MPRLVFVADLHGSLEVYRAAGTLALDEEADLLVLGGDLCPGAKRVPLRLLPAAQSEFLLAEIAPLLREWKRRRPTLQVLAIPGNNDFRTVLAALAALERDGLLWDLHQRVVEVGGVTWAGLAFVPPTPFPIKDFERRDLAAEEPPAANPFESVIASPAGVHTLENVREHLAGLPSIEEELEALDRGQANRRLTVAVMHGPPFGTACDLLQGGRHVGSRAVRAWIERRQPRITLHGHIHESPLVSGAFADRLGATWVVNPGADPRTPHLVLLELTDPFRMRHSRFGDLEAGAERTDNS